MICHQINKLFLFPCKERILHCLFLLVQVLLTILSSLSKIRMRYRCCYLWINWNVELSSAPLFSDILNCLQHLSFLTSWTAFSTSLFWHAEPPSAPLFSDMLNHLQHLSFLICWTTISTSLFWHKDLLCCSIAC